MEVINQNKNFTHFYIFYVECNNFILIITPIYKSEKCLHHAAHNWVVWIQLSNLFGNKVHSSGIKQLDIVLAK